MVRMPFFFGFFAFGIVVLVFTIMTAVDASKYPEWAFQQTGSSKFVWQILPIVFLFGLGGAVMALIWFTSKREAVAVAARQGPPYGYGAPPPGWGPPPGGGWSPPAPPPPTPPSSYPPPGTPPPPYPAPGPPPGPPQ
jgi:hypothetical protein